MSELKELSGFQLLESYDNLDWMSFQHSSEGKSRYVELRAELLRLLDIAKQVEQRSESLQVQARKAAIEIAEVLVERVRESRLFSIQETEAIILKHLSAGEGGQATIRRFETVDLILPSMSEQWPEYGVFVAIKLTYTHIEARIGGRDIRWSRETGRVTDTGFFVEPGDAESV